MLEAPTARPDAVPRSETRVEVSGHNAEAGKRNGTAVIVSTRGRPGILKALVEQLAQQSKPPEHLFVVASRAEDIAASNPNQDNLTIHIGRTGSSLQRNDGL